ncbi:SUZ domain-containing protein 1-like isoform X2 [Panonychus citri]|uniref:SUZ domain-containing protein 1-like isoform X2 n=1 Tax=Panonychus citri TaxID=50023 RepID=UPI0023072806|nr:SUZ domain-containing protein 1-like isoform X2 [Panonychus citri]
MAEAPLESWEDLETENEALPSKLGKIKFDGTCEDKKGVDCPSQSEGITKGKTNNFSGNEDNTRTQYVPQVRILQRPKGPPQGSKNGQDGENKSPSKSNGNNLITKSYQEREAEYAKVRLRILGSAVPDYKDSDLVPSASLSFASSTSTSTSNTVVTNSRQANGDISSQASGSKSSCELPVVRFPQGPDGSKGFSSRRRKAKVYNPSSKLRDNY